MNSSYALEEPHDREMHEEKDVNRRWDDSGLVSMNQEVKQKIITGTGSDQHILSANERNIISTAQAISREQYKEWIPILKKLTIGTCVLSGEYSVNGHRLTQNRSLVCKVMSE